MRPYQISAFFALVFSLFALVIYLFPKDGIRVNSFLKIKLPSFSEFFQQDTTQYADISDIIENDTITIDTTVFHSVPKIKEEEAESIEFIKPKVITNIDQDPKAIQYPNGEKETLYPFFRHLKKQKGKIRIIHYGDSQIEGDRITSYIRDRLQKQFGGSGPGILPAKSAYNHSRTVYQKSSDNWTRHSLLGKKDTVIEHKKYGVLTAFSRFMPPKDTSNHDTSKTNAWVKYTIANTAYKSMKKFTKCRILYGNTNDEVGVKILSDDTELGNGVLMPNKDVDILEFSLSEPKKEITLQFEGQDSPDIYGVSLESEDGVIVDNVPLRGSAGLEFTKTDLRHLKKMYKKLNVKLLLLEFGVNVVPYVVDDYSYYENWFYRQLRSLKSLDKDLCIIVIGVSDMSRKVKDEYVSYPNIEIIRDAQRNAAFKAGCAFWDMYENMGGENSMPSWVFEDPPLARKDFTHFNATGAKKIAGIFYDSFIGEYNKYIKNPDNK